ncbi:MAG: glycosyltransferase family 9 protein [Candidatus Omnitrophota bacterium]
MFKKILFFTLSNFGDVILTLPLLDALRQDYSDARITVMVGPRPAEVFKNNPHIDKLIIYNKYAPLREKIQLFIQLKKEGFDAVIDLRNTLFGALLPVRFKTSPFLRMPAKLRHMKERNLYRLTKALGHKGTWGQARQGSLYISREDENYVNLLLQENGIKSEDRFIIISPVTGGTTRRWEEEKFVQLCLKLARDYLVILIGRKDDANLTRQIKVDCARKIFDFAGLTNLAQLAYLLKKSQLVVVCDTGVLHLASYLNIPIVGLFGPSDERRYGPWSSRFKVVASEVPCRPCRSPDCKFNTVECMRKISVVQVLDSIDALLK